MWYVFIFILICVKLVTMVKKTSVLVKAIGETSYHD
jgi:hypothetical protein